MTRIVEQVIVVFSITGTRSDLVREACDAIARYVDRGALVASVSAKPLVFQVPAAAAPGRTLNSELTQQLQASIGAVVFVDDLRPNVAYELGFVHGSGRCVLLVTERPVAETWLSISDLAGSAILDLSRQSLQDGIKSYLDRVYADLAAVRPYAAPALPTEASNMLGRLVNRARINVQAYPGDFGPCITVDTWGGIVFDAGYNLMPGAGFKVVFRARELGAVYSVYFRLSCITTAGTRSSMFIGLTSNQSRLGLEAHERNLPSQALTAEWRMLSGSFQDVLKRGHVLGIERVEHLELIRVRAGAYQADPYAKAAAYDIGHLEVSGVET